MRSVATITAASCCCNLTSRCSVEAAGQIELLLTRRLPFALGLHCVIIGKFGYLRDKIASLCNLVLNSRLGKFSRCQLCSIGGRD